MQEFLAHDLPRVKVIVTYYSLVISLEIKFTRQLNPHMRVSIDIRSFSILFIFQYLILNY